MEQPVRIPLEALNFQFPFSLLISNFIIIFLFVGLYFFLFGEFLLLPNIGPLDELALELLACLALHDVECILIDGLLLADLMGMVNDHIILHIELTHVEREVLGHVQGVLQLLLHLVFQEVVDRVLEQLLPLDALLRVHHDHLPKHVLGDCRNRVVTVFRDH